MWRAVMLALLVVTVAGCGAVAPSASRSASRVSVSPDGDTPTVSPEPVARERPLALPTMGANCPSSVVHSVLPDVGLGIGSGPVWPVGFVAGPAVQPLGSHPIDTWYPFKILWASGPDYTGPVRVRGQRIDQAGAMEFSLDGGRTLTSELWLPADTTPNAERQWPSYTLVETAGCYAYQIDGADFSGTAVFEVVP